MTTVLACLAALEQRLNRVAPVEPGRRPHFCAGSACRQAGLHIVIDVIDPGPAAHEDGEEHDAWIL